MAFLSFSSYRTFFFIVVSSIFFITCFGITAHAQSSAGIGINPPVFDPERAVEPGEALQYSLRVSNLENAERELFVTTRDISTVGEGGVPEFATPDSEPTGFELSDWLSFSEDTFIIGPNETKSIDVLIMVPDDAPPGSHFGAVNISSQAPQLEQTGAAVSYGVNGIVTIRVAGDALESALIRSFSTDRFIYSNKDVTFTARIENEGNVLVRPFGLIEVRNMYGAEVAQIDFNSSRASVFPNTARSFSANWEEDGLGFGRYEAVISLSYGPDGARRSISTTASFWILPMSIIGPGIAILVTLLLCTYIFVRLYIRRALRTQSAGRRRSGQGRSSGIPFGLLVIVSMLTVTALFLLTLLVLFA